MILSTASLPTYRRQVVMADGSFDCLHPGHIAYLREAASFGYPLLVNLCPDAETAKKHPVLIPAAQRAEVIHAIKGVEYVHVSEQPTVEVLRALHPMVYVKGADWVDRLPTAIGQVCDELKIRVRHVGTPKASSTAILKQFQPDVDAFERLVLSQQPASTPWEPTAAVPYDFESRKIAEGKHPELIRDVFQPRRVLDAGCGPGHLVTLLRDVGVEAIGGDTSTHSGVRYFDLAAAPLIGSDEPSWDDWETFDLVICREVLEHMTIRHIAQAVRNLCRLSSRFVYLTTRFTHARHFLDFATADAIDPTHITIMPMPWLRHLFTLEGFKRRADLEQRMDHRGLNRVLVYERAA